jgi:hypothetical protein
MAKKKYGEEEVTSVDPNASGDWKADAADASVSGDPNSVAGSFETEAQKQAREEREARAAEAGREEPLMSPVNPRKPLDKEPVYAGGTGPNLGVTGDPGVKTPSDPRIPPENVTVTATVGVTESKVVETAQPVQAAQPAPIPTPAQAGLPQPELRPGLDPLPEEEPTPSTVPIPPPGPRRVA